MIDPDTLRTLDRWVGVPLCAMLTGLRGLARALAPARPCAAAPRTVLFIELAEMGAVVLAEPALRHARARGARPLFLIFDQNRDVLRLTGTVRPEDVFGLRTHRLAWLLVDVLRFCLWARRRRVDAVVDLEPFCRFSAALAFITGARVRAGFHRRGAEGLYRGDLFTRRVAYVPERHISENLLALARAVLPGAAPAPERRPLRAPPTPDETTRVDATLAASCPAFVPAQHRVVLINPNVGDLVPQRRWPRSRYAQLIRALLDRYPDVCVFILGAAQERESAGALAAEVGAVRCASVAGRFAIPELPALFSRSALLVTSDSGPAHFAAVTPMPALVLFGPETPLRYRPLGDAISIYAGLPCSPCVSAANQRRSRCADNRCMQAISAALVFREARNVLEGRRKPADLREDPLRERAG